MEKTAELIQANKLVQITNILVGTDFSPASERALDYAISVARRYEARIILAHVITTSTDVMLAPEIAANTHETTFSKAQEEMGQFLVSGRLRGVQHETVIEEGALWPTLDALITRYKVDLVMVGTHKFGGLHKLFLGSGAEQIFRQAKVPVLTVGPGVEGAAPNEGQFKRILFATDFGLGAEREAAYAFSLAQEHEANVTLLHVVPRVDDHTESGTALRIEAVSNSLAELVPPGAEVWCKPEVRVLFGDPVQAILRTAQEMKADLLVIGAKRKKGLAAGHALHTVAYRLAGTAPCPVLTVRS